MFGHLRWVGRFLARHIKVQHLTVFWTVTGEDAAQTAELYGAAMAAANNLLAFLQQVVCLQCDHLQLESDFTGQRRGERYISGRLHTHTFLLLWLLIRLLFRLTKTRSCSLHIPTGTKIAFCFYKRRSFPWQSIRSKV